MTVPAPNEITLRRGYLALSLQEAFTAAVRLRSNRQVASDAGTFRAHIKQLLATADTDARRAGYTGDDVKLAIYAYTVFLDESVLNSPQPMFADWPRKPLQEEVFGGHMGGEYFYDHLRSLLGRQDSEDVADLLEVFELCLLLGFRGRYSVADRSEVRNLIASVTDKIRRVRGPGALAPSWAPPSDELVPKVVDPWLKRLRYAAAGTFAFAILLFFIFTLSLRSGLGDLRALTAQLGV
jgi:type VI secretion system protein ImpK